MRRRLPTMLACGVLAAVVAACSPAASTPGPSSGFGGSGGVGGRGPVVNVQAVDFRFDPSTITVAAGKVTFHVRNGGSAEHEFEIIKDGQARGEIEGLVPGLEKDLTVDLPAGAYSIECHLPGHLEQGMKATLTVTP
jgi:iron uptake system component EfeO